MGKTVQSWGIPTELSLEQFGQFVLPRLTVGRRGPAPKRSLHALFNYILKLLYLGCQMESPTGLRSAIAHLPVATSKMRHKGQSVCTSTPHDCTNE